MLFQFLFSVGNFEELRSTICIIIMATLQMEYLVTKLFVNEEGLDAKPQFGTD